MKKTSIVILIMLIALAVYIIYRLFNNGEFVKTDYVLLIILLAGGAIDLVIINKWRKKSKED